MSADTDRRARQQDEEILALRGEIRQLRQDLDVLRSGRLGTLGFRKTALVGDNALNTAKYQDGSVTSAKLAGVDPAKLADGDLEAAVEVSGSIDITDGWIGSTGRYRWNAQGLQMLADDNQLEQVGLIYVPTYVDDTTNTSGDLRPNVDFWSGIFGNADNSDNYIRLISRNYTDDATDWFAEVLSYADASNSFARMRAQLDGGTQAQAQVVAYASALGIFELSGCALILDSDTSDPTGSAANDGALLYRSDTDKFRARVNGAWVNLLTSADSVGLVLDYELATGDFAPTPGDVVHYTGTGGHTITFTSFVADSFGMAKHSGSGLLTVQMALGGTLDGLASITLAPGDAVSVFGVGANTGIIV